MKPVPKLTEHFFNQAPELQQIIVDAEIQAYRMSLLDCQNCTLCLQPYSIVQPQRLPRILVHCGHTFCTQCLAMFFVYVLWNFRKNRIRCPACLKLVKKLSFPEELPINHTIYQKISKKHNNKSDGYKFLCTDFTISCANRIRESNASQIDEESGLSYCSFHPEEIEHFFCVYHDVPGCRECMEVRHKREECKLMDLYDMMKSKK